MAVAQVSRRISSARYERELKAYGRKVSAVIAAHFRDVMLGIRRAGGKLPVADEDEDEFLDEEGFAIDPTAGANEAFWEREAAKAAERATATVPIPEAAVRAEGARIHTEAVRARRTAMLRAGAKRSVLAARLGVEIGEVVGLNMRLTIAELVAQEQWVDRNLALIKTIPQTTVQEWTGWLTDSIAEGQTYRAIQDRIIAETGASDWISERIARDQVNKAQSDIGRAFAREVGSDWFIWRIAAKDGRTRASHVAVADRFWRYSDPPPGVGVRGEPDLPGHPIMCRCYDEVWVPPELLGEPGGAEPVWGALA